MIKKLDRYDILGILGRGSMGVVYKGVDPHIGKLVAIKTMNPKTVRHKDMQERFYREGNLLGQLQHKNLITVYNVGTDGDICFIAMEFLDGVSLEQMLEKREPFTLHRVLRIVLQVCEGVGAAHRKNITHRDLKPANIFVLENDLVKVLDFGVARLQDSDLTNSGMLLGTINYIAPEQITGLTIDHRADIFSLGVILYELLTGINPFLGRNVSKTMVKIINENPPIPKELPELLRGVLGNMLEKDRERRYGSMVEVAADLEKAFRLPDGPIRAFASAGASKGAREKQLDARLEEIKKHLRREELDEAERLLGEVEQESAASANLEELRSRLERARRGVAGKHIRDSLEKVEKLIAERHYVLAIEICDEVLGLDKGNTKARALQTTCIYELERYVAKLREEGKA